MCIEVNGPYKWTRCKKIPKTIFQNRSYSKTCPGGDAEGAENCPKLKPLMKPENLGTTSKVGDCPCCKDDWYVESGSN
jgi:hypothetical protein